MKVVVVGNCSLDRSFVVPRFPHPGETLLATCQKIDVGGKGANQAVCAARAGVETLFLAAVGRDPDGEAIIERFVSEKIDVTYVLRTRAATDQSIIYVTAKGENSIVSSHAAAASVSPLDVDGILLRCCRDDILLMQGNLSFATTRHCLEAARRVGAQTVLNPSPIQYAYDALWPLVDFAILNEHEIGTLSGLRSPIRGGRRLLNAGAANVVTTLGARGLVAIFGARIVEIRASSVIAVDTTGAGDVFCGVFAAGLARGLVPPAAARIAAAAASLSVTRARMSS